MTASKPYYEWTRPLKLREYYVDRHFDSVEEAEKQLYLAVIRGDVRARRGEVVFGPEWLKQISKMRFSDTDPFALPPDIELSVEDAMRLWP
jgi:hypothetical protein